MVTFRKNNNHNRRGRFRTNDRNFKRNGDNSKFKSDFSTNIDFQRKSPGRNNHNAPKLIEKYNDLAREALTSGDKILSESYFQHADHFKRILKEQERNRIVKKTDEPVKELNDNKKKFDNKPNNSEKNQESEKKIGLVKTIELASSKN